MWAKIISVFMYVLSTNAVKTLIAIAINKLLVDKTDGITRDLAMVMIESIAKSQMNPTKEDMFSEILEALKKEDNEEETKDSKEPKVIKKTRETKKGK